MGRVFFVSGSWAPRCSWAARGLLMGGTSKPLKVWETRSRGAVGRQHEQKEM
ncbi:unnamed protein product [Ectocarpus sp. 13 AM-2016]